MTAWVVSCGATITAGELAKNFAFVVTAESSLQPGQMFTFDPTQDGLEFVPADAFVSGDCTLA